MPSTTEIRTIKLYSRKVGKNTYVHKIQILTVWCCKNLQICQDYMLNSTVPLHNPEIKVYSLYLGGEVSEGPALQAADPGVKDQEGDLQGSRRTDSGGITGEYCQRSLQGMDSYSA